MRTKRKALCSFLYCIRVHAILVPMLLLCVVSCTVLECMRLGSSATAGDMTKFCCGGLDTAKLVGLDGKINETRRGKIMIEQP